MKREAVMKILPDTKILAEIASTAHTLYHPLKSEKDITNIKMNLAKLINEAEKRRIMNTQTIIWAKSLLTEKGVTFPDSNIRFTPNRENLDKFKSLTRKRTTNRFVSSLKIDKKVIYELIECAIQAPSSCNRQGWRFIIIENKKKIEEISEIKNQKFIRDFPYLILCCFDENVYIGTDKEMTPYLDCGAALMNLCNAAAAAGLSASWLNFAKKNTKKENHIRLRRLINLPKNLMPVSFIGIGIPRKVIIKPPREDVVFYMPLEKNGKKRY